MKTPFVSLNFLTELLVSYKFSMSFIFPVILFSDFSILPKRPFFPWFIYNGNCPYQQWDCRKTYCAPVSDDPDFVSVKTEYETEYSDDSMKPFDFSGSSVDDLQDGWQSA